MYRWIQSLVFVNLATWVLVTRPDCSASPYRLSWTQIIDSSDDDTARSVGIDAAGNIFVTGTTRGVLGNENFGNSDAFIQKYDSTGKPIWSQQLGSSGLEASHSLATDSGGNVFITGTTTNGNLDISSYDAFLAKYDGDGNLAWQTQIGANTVDQSWSVAVDQTGNAYISGVTYGEIATPVSGANDAFLVKYDSDGNHLWSRQLGISDRETAYAVTIDALGNPIIAGNQSPLNGSHDEFLAKYDADGNLQWIKERGYPFRNESFSIATDVNGNLFVSGQAGGGQGSLDASITKYDGDGNFLWSQLIGTTLRDSGNTITVDEAGNAYVAGNMGFEAFVSKLDPSGNEVWHKRLGTLSFDQAWGIAIDDDGNLLVVGDDHAGAAESGFLMKLSVVPEPASNFLFVGGIAIMFWIIDRQKYICLC